MAASELHSFMIKFLNLWKSGKEANLNVESRAGHIYVNLKADLGSQQSPQEHPPRSHHRPGPSRVRCRERREAARLTAVGPGLTTAKEFTAAEEATVDDQEASAAESDTNPEASEET